MPLESEILVSNYGVSSAFAEALLRYTKGDIEAAIRLVESSEKDIIALKAKFISSKKMINGGLLLCYNYQSTLPEYAFCVITNDQAMGRTKLEGPWKEFGSELTRFLGAAESDPDASQRVETMLLSPDNIKYLNSFFVDRKNLDLVNIKRFLLSELSKVLMDTAIVLKIVVEEADVFRYKTFFNETKLGLKIIPQNAIADVMLLNLKVEPVLTPIGGLDVEKVQAGDEVLVRLTDPRDIAVAIKDLAPKKEDVQSGIYGRVVRNLKPAGSENLVVTLEFGPGIYGTFIMGGKIRIQVIPAAPGTAKDTKPHQGKTESYTQQTAQVPAPSSWTPPQEVDPAAASKKNKNSMTFLVVVAVLLGLTMVGMLIAFLAG